MSSSIHLTSLNKLSKPFCLGGDHKGRYAEEREKTIILWFITHQHIHFSCSAWNKHKTCPPIPGPFLLMAWLLNSHRADDVTLSASPRSSSIWSGPCFDRFGKCHSRLEGVDGFQVFIPQPMIC